MAGWARFWKIGFLLFGIGVGCGKTDRSRPTPQPPATGGAAVAARADAGAGAGGVEQSGPRLVPWQLEAEGTEPLVLGIFDTQQQAHCRFLPDSEGQLRCLPEAPAEPLLTEYFLDSACQRRIYYAERATVEEAKLHPIAFPLPLPAGCEPRRYVVGSVQSLEQPLTVYTGPACTEQPAFAIESELLIAIDEVVVPDSFVTGKRVDGPALASQLRLQRIETETGEQFDERVFDEHWSSLCSLVDTVPPLCIPDYAESRATYFADEACTEPVWKVAACEAPTFIVGSSGFGGTNHLLGAPYEGPVYANPGKGGCQPYAPKAVEPDRFYLEGPAITGDLLQSFEWQTLGSGRLQVRGIRGASGDVTVVANPLANWRRFYDTAVAADCLPIWNLKGEVRCVPNVTVADSRDSTGFFFVDDQCQKPAYMCSEPPKCGADPHGLAVVIPPGEARRASSITKLLNVTTGIYVNAGGACTLDPTLSGFVTLGDELPWDDFPRLTERNPRTPPGP